MTEESIVDLVKKHSTGEMPQDEVAKKAAILSEAIPEDKQTVSILEKLLSNVRKKMNWIEVGLPSQGLLYDNNVSSVEIRPFTYDEERLLKSSEALLKPEQVVEKLLRNCVKGIDVSELTPHDRLYILFRIRGMSYGDSYPITHDCEKCGNSNKLNLKISTLETKPLTEEHMKFTLPDSQQEVVIKLPRTQDEHLFNTPELMMENLHLFVYSIGGVTDKTIIEAFIRQTTVRDIDVIRNHIFSPDYGMENHFFYNCKNCGARNRVHIELNENFFTAS